MWRVKNNNKNDNNEKLQLKVHFLKINRPFNDWMNEMHTTRCINSIKKCSLRITSFTPAVLCGWCVVWRRWCGALLWRWRWWMSVCSTQRLSIRLSIHRSNIECNITGQLIIIQSLSTSIFWYWIENSFQFFTRAHFFFDSSVPQNDWKMNTISHFN